MQEASVQNASGNKKGTALLVTSLLLAGLAAVAYFVLPTYAAELLAYGIDIAPYVDAAAFGLLGVALLLVSYSIFSGTKKPAKQSEAAETEHSTEAIVAVENSEEKTPKGKAPKLTAEERKRAKQAAKFQQEAQKDAARAAKEAAKVLKKHAKLAKKGLAPAAESLDDNWVTETPVPQLEALEEVTVPAGETTLDNGFILDDTVTETALTGTGLYQPQILAPTPVAAPEPIAPSRGWITAAYQDDTFVVPLAAQGRALLDATTLPAPEVEATTDETAAEEITAEEVTVEETFEVPADLEVLVDSEDLSAPAPLEEPAMPAFFDDQITYDDTASEPAVEPEPVAEPVVDEEPAVDDQPEAQDEPATEVVSDEQPVVEEEPAAEVAPAKTRVPRRHKKRERAQNIAAERTQETVTEEPEEAVAVELTSDEPADEQADDNSPEVKLGWWARRRAAKAAAKEESVVDVNVEDDVQEVAEPVEMIVEEPAAPRSRNRRKKAEPAAEEPILDETVVADSTSQVGEETTEETNEETTEQITEESAPVEPRLGWRARRRAAKEAAKEAATLEAQTESADSVDAPAEDAPPAEETPTPVEAQADEPAAQIARRTPRRRTPVKADQESEAPVEVLEADAVTPTKPRTRTRKPKPVTEDVTPETVTPEEAPQGDETSPAKPRTRTRTPKPVTEDAIAPVEEPNSAKPVRRRKSAASSEQPADVNPDGTTVSVEPATLEQADVYKSALAEIQRVVSTQGIDDSNVLSIINKVLEDSGLNLGDRPSEDETPSAPRRKPRHRK